MPTITTPRPYTPGPWEIDPQQPNIVRASNAGYLIADTFAYNTSKANGHLISAAPDLLEALQDLLRQVESGTAPEIVTGRAISAINKALGR